MAEEISNDQIVYLMDVIKDSVANLARDVFMALEDGRIDFWEGLRLGTLGTSSLAAIASAIQTLDRADLQVLIDALAQSDLVIKQ